MPASILSWLIPSLVSAGSTIYSATRKQPKTSTYQPSQWEQDYYNKLSRIYGGTEQGFNVEGNYNLQKSKLLPEYERLQKEYGVYAARKGISGGPVASYGARLNERQIGDLIKLRQQLENQNQQLKMTALQGMGQLGQARSQAEYQQKMMELQQQMAQYQQLQDALGQLTGTGMQVAYNQAYPQANMEELFKKYYGTGQTSSSQTGIGINPQSYYRQFQGLEGVPK